MKQRNVIAVVCFSIITLGIYDLFWLASTKKELNARTKQHVPSLWLLLAPIALLIVMAIIDGAVSTAQSTSGTSSPVGVIIGILLGIVVVFAAIVVPVYWFLKYSKAVHEYTNGELSTAVTFILLWVLRFVGIAVIQDKFNDMLTAGGATMPMTGGMAAPIMPQAPGVTPIAMTTPPSNSPMGPGAESAQAMPPAPQQPIVQPPQPQASVDSTRPESYDQQQQTPPSPQPPTPPSGPVVQ